MIVNLIRSLCIKIEIRGLEIIHSDLIRTDREGFYRAQR